jgi:uncharacterized YigZ family protein
MNTSYPIPAGENKIELEIKRSKFIAYAINVTDREHADAFVKHLKKTNPKANHVCWAYIAGAPETTARSMSDDGEPTGTAGMPMLKVLQYSGLGDVAVAVVRYFGGTKLGKGGLQRAYSHAVVQVLENLPSTLKVSRLQLRIEYDYNFQEAISRLLQHYAVQGLAEKYDSSVINSFAVAISQVSALEAELINITSDNIIIYRPDE